MGPRRGVFVLVITSLFLTLAFSVNAAPLPDATLSIIPFDAQIDSNVVCFETISSNYDSHIITKKYAFNYDGAWTDWSYNNSYDCSKKNCATGKAMQCKILFENEAPTQKVITSANTITISPKKPVITSIAITPKNPTVTSTLDCQETVTGSYTPTYSWYKLSGSVYQVIAGATAKTLSNTPPKFAAGDVIKCTVTATNQGAVSQASFATVISSNNANKVEWYVPYGQYDSKVLQVSNRRDWPSVSHGISDLGVGDYMIQLTCKGGTCADTLPKLSVNTNTLGHAFISNTPAYSLVDNPLSKTTSFPLTPQETVQLKNAYKQQGLSETDANSKVANIDQTLKRYQATKSANCLANMKADIPGVVTDKDECTTAWLFGEIDQTAAMQFESAINSAVGGKIDTSSKTLTIQSETTALDCSKVAATSITLTPLAVQENIGVAVDYKVMATVGTTQTDVSKSAAFYVENPNIAEFYDPYNPNRALIVGAGQTNIIVRFCGFESTTTIRGLGPLLIQERLCSSTTLANWVTVKGKAQDASGNPIIPAGATAIIPDVISKMQLVESKDITALAARSAPNRAANVVLTGLIGEDSTITVLKGSRYQSEPRLIKVTKKYPEIILSATDRAGQIADKLSEQPRFYQLTNNAYTAVYKNCEPNSDDFCATRQYSCAYNGNCYNDASLIKINRNDRVVAVNAAPNDAAFSYLKCSVASPGQWSAVTATSANVCDATFQVVCTEDSSIYNQGVTYAQVGETNYFCANLDNSKWDWVQSTSGLDAFETVHSTEICGPAALSGAASIDNNCNAHKSFERYIDGQDKGKVRYNRWINKEGASPETFEVSPDADAFDTQCYGQLTTKVVDSAGNAIEGATVQINIVTGLTQKPGKIYKTGTTIAAGTYAVPSVPATYFLIQVSKQNYQTIETAVKVEYKENKQLQIVLPTTGCVGAGCTPQAQTDQIKCADGSSVIIIERVAIQNGEPVIVKIPICKK